MNKYHIIPAFILLLLVTACGRKTLKGEGNKTTATPAVASFSAVIIDVPLHATFNVQSGAQPSVQIGGYENVLKHIKTQVENNVLHIYTDLDDTWSVSGEGMTAQITLPLLTAITINGKDDAEIHGPVSGSAFKLEIDGAGNVNMDNVTVDNFSIVLSGAGEISVQNGSVKYADYNLNGAGTVKAKALQANEAKASINGAGSISVSASQKLTASINGAGAIRYRGNPEVSKDINGPGSISKID